MLQYCPANCKASGGQLHRWRSFRYSRRRRDDSLLTRSAEQVHHDSGSRTNPYWCSYQNRNVLPRIPGSSTNTASIIRISESVSAVPCNTRGLISPWLRNILTLMLASAAGSPSGDPGTVPGQWDMCKGQWPLPPLDRHMAGSFYCLKLSSREGAIMVYQVHI